jgi:hypothetical protein
MNFFAFSKKDSNNEETKRFRLLYDSDCIKQQEYTRYKPEYWFALYDNSNMIVAECEVHRFNSFWWCNRKEKYEITDVRVHPKYRGNEYCGLLLLNVMYYFDQRVENPEQLSFELWAHRSNLSAQRAYRKIFRNESNNAYQYTVHELIRFST